MGVFWLPTLIVPTDRSFRREPVREGRSSPRLEGLLESCVTGRTRTELVDEKETLILRVRESRRGIKMRDLWAGW